MPDLASLVHRDLEILSGPPVFVGTRVPARTLFEFLCAGDSLDAFLEQFPTVKRERAVALPKLAEGIVEGRARPSR